VSLGGERPEENPLPTPPIIYIADDSDVVRNALERRLTSDGFVVHTGGSAADSRSVTIRAFACALLDLDLGDGDGVDVAEVLRAHQPDLPVAFFSGGAAPSVMTRARELGPIFRKPDEFEEALTWVKTWARR
jgi:two-component system, response regulator RegA